MAANVTRHRLRSISRGASFQRINSLSSVWRWPASTVLPNGHTAVHKNTLLRHLSTVSDDGSESAERREPWKTLLEIPARAAWRVSDPRLPTDLDESVKKILKNGRRSRKVLQRVHEDIIKSHRLLADRRERERRRALSDQQFRGEDKKGDASAQPVVYGPEEALSSFRFRFHPNFEVIKRVLLECRSLLSTNDSAWTPRHVVDFGIGSGGASAAALDVWGDVEWIHGIDSSRSMRDGAKDLLEDIIEHRGKVGRDRRLTFSAHLSAERAPPAFDLALFAYTATELTHGASVLAAAAILWEKLLPNGLLVMVEPGTPDGFSAIRSVRNMLLDSCPPGAGGDDGACHVVAPCTHNGPCPLERYAHLRPQVSRTQTTQSVSDGEEEQDGEGETGGLEVDAEEGGRGLGDGLRKGYCSFVHTMPNKGGSSSSEKFSYLVGQKRVEQHGSNESSFGASAVDLLKETRDCESVDRWEEIYHSAVNLEAQYTGFDGDELGLELLSEETGRSSFGRIINAPMKKRGHVLIDCCTAPGHVVRHTVSKSMSNSAPGLYAAARKSRWGGFWPNVHDDDN